MEEYILRSATVAEIKRRIENLHPKGGQGMIVTKILKDHYEDLLTFLNTIEVKYVQEEIVSKDLEKAAEELDESMYRSDAFKVGAKWHEQQMMKDAFDATVCKVGSTYLKEIDRDAIAKALEPYEDGDRVKVIIKAQKGE